MNHEIVVRSPELPAVALAAELAALSTGALRAELARALEISAAQLLRLAAIVRTLEERGEDLSDLKLGMLGHLRRIAYGQVLAGVVVRYAEHPLLLRRIESLPLPDQQRFAAGEPVPLVVWGPDGSPTHRLIDPLYLTRDQIAQVFGPRGLRAEAEQILVLEDRGRPAPGPGPPRPTPTRVGRLTADRRRGVLRVGRTALPVADVIAALALLRSDDETPEEDLTEQVAFRMTASEQTAFRVRAARAGLSMAALARRAALSLGLLTTQD